MLVAITGVGGSGKTALAEALAKRMKWRLMSLNDLAARAKAYIGYDKKRQSKIVSVAKMKKELRKLMKESPKKYENLIIEGLYAHEFPADIVVVLRCEPKVLEKRLRRKYTWPTKITENVEAEMIGLIADEAVEYHDKNVYEIDTTESTAAQTAAKIEKIISLAASGESNELKKYRVGRIDWLKAANF